MNKLIILLILPQLCLAGGVSIGLESGMTAPITSLDNQRYNPSIYIQPILFYQISPTVRLFSSYGHVFARGGEFIEDNGYWGDEFGNYQTRAYFLKLGIDTDISFVNLSGGIGSWYYRTDRDQIGDSGMD